MARQPWHSSRDDGVDQEVEVRRAKAREYAKARRRRLEADPDALAEFKRKDAEAQRKRRARLGDEHRQREKERHDARWENDPEYRKKKRRNSRNKDRRLKDERPEEWKSQNKARSIKHMCKRRGITVEDYDRMHAEQGGVCKICGQAETRVLRYQVCRLSIDHCHETDKVRGLLCNTCNRGLGFFKDSADVMRAAIEYLESSKQS